MKPDPKSLEHQIKVSMLAYPDLYKKREEVINHLYCILGNGCDWVGGCLVDVCDDEKLRLVDEMLAAGAPEDEIRKKVAGIDKAKGFKSAAEFYAEMSEKIRALGLDPSFLEKPGTWQPELSIYPVSDLCLIWLIPDDVRPDWLAGAEEAVLLMETKNSSDEKNTAENRRLAVLIRERIAAIKRGAVVENVKVSAKR